MSRLVLHFYSVFTQLSETRPRHSMANEINMVMLGHTGAGKSSTGNSILGVGEEKFDSYTGVTSKTNCVNRQKLNNEIFSREMPDKHVYLVDTPGFFDTRRQNVETDILKELRKFKPHVFLLVISLRNRFPKEAEDTLDRIEIIFGEEVYRHSVVVFAGEDYLKDTSLETFVRTAIHPKVAQLIQKCGNRYVAFDNHATDTRQVRYLLEEVKKIENLSEPFIIPSNIFIRSLMRSSWDSFSSFREKSFLYVTDRFKRNGNHEDKGPAYEDTYYKGTDTKYEGEGKTFERQDKQLARTRRNRYEFIMGIVVGVLLAIFISFFLLQQDYVTVRNSLSSVETIILRTDVSSSDTKCSTCFDIANRTLDNIFEAVLNKYTERYSSRSFSSIKNCVHSCLKKVD